MADTRPAAKTDAERLMVSVKASKGSDHMTLTGTLDIDGTPVRLSVPMLDTETVAGILRKTADMLDKTA